MDGTDFDWNFEIRLMFTEIKVKSEVLKNDSS